jgi:hypothetical protein
MDKAKWEKCPYFSEGKCPQSKFIDRAYLIPQLLDRSELEEAVRICGDCGQYLPERRKRARLKRTFESYIHKEYGETTIPGNVVDVSGRGTLIKLKDWLPFDIDEKVQIEIYPRRNRRKRANNKIIRASGEVKRIDSVKRELAVVFLHEVDHQALRSL